MHNVLFVHVINSFAYLSSEQNTVFFGQREIVGYHSFEQFSAGNAGKKNRTNLCKIRLRVINNYNNNYGEIDYFQIVKNKITDFPRCLLFGDHDHFPRILESRV